VLAAGDGGLVSGAVADVAAYAETVLIKISCLLFLASDFGNATDFSVGNYVFVRLRAISQA
jgi:hypothetical protein